MGGMCHWCVFGVCHGAHLPAAGRQRGTAAWEERDAAEGAVQRRGELGRPLHSLAKAILL